MSFWKAKKETGENRWEVKGSENDRTDVISFAPEEDSHVHEGVVHKPDGSKEIFSVKRPNKK